MPMTNHPRVRTPLAANRPGWTKQKELPTAPDWSLWEHTSGGTVLITYDSVGNRIHATRPDGDVMPLTTTLALEEATEAAFDWVEKAEQK